MHKHPSKAKDSKSDFSFHVLIKSIVSSGLQIFNSRKQRPNPAMRAGTPLVKI